MKSVFQTNYNHRFEFEFALILFYNFKVYAQFMVVRDPTFTGNNLNDHAVDDDGITV